MLKFTRDDLRRQIENDVYTTQRRARQRWVPNATMTITPNNSRRFRKYEAVTSCSLRFMDQFYHMGRSNNDEKNITQSERYKEILSAARRELLRNHITTSVLESPKYGKEAVDDWLNKQPGVAANIEDSRILTTIPLGLDVEFPGNLDHYTSETADLSELWTELRCYDYLINASQNLLRDIWLATRREAEDSCNKKINIFNYWGYHNLFAKRALKLYEMYRQDPVRTVKHFIAKNVISSHRRLRITEEDNFKAMFQSKYKDAFAAYLRETISPDFDPEAYDTNSEFEAAFPVLAYTYEQLGAYLCHLQCMAMTSVLCDYTTPIFLDSTAISRMMADSAIDVELDIARMYANEERVAELYTSKYNDSKAVYIGTALLRGLNHPKCGMKLDFERGMRRGSLLTADDIVSKYENSATFSTDKSLQVTSNHTANAWMVFPVYVQDATLSDHKQNMDTNQTSCYSETTELDVVYQMANENINLHMIKLITFGANAMYPSEFTYRRLSSLVLANKLITYCEEQPGHQASAPITISSIIDENDTPRFTVSQLGFWDRETVHTCHSLTIALGFNSAVLQNMSMFYTKYVEWVENNFNIDELPVAQQKLIDRAKLLSKLLAKHGAPERATTIITNIVSQLKPMPTNDF